MNDLKKLLQKTLDQAHKSHRYIADSVQHGVTDQWNISLVGDCEDFALWCKAALKEHGIASDLVLCKTSDGEGHLVCSVENYILDNRHKFVMLKQDLNYKWIAIGKPDGRWLEILS